MSSENTRIFRKLKKYSVNIVSMLTYKQLEDRDDKAETLATSACSMKRKKMQVNSLGKQRISLLTLACCRPFFVKVVRCLFLSIYL